MVWYNPGTWFKKEPETKQEPATTRTEVPAQKTGVIVTDYKTGESVKTTTSGGSVTSQKYSSAPPKTYGYASGSTYVKEVGETAAIEGANRPGGLVEQAKASTANTGALKPASITTSAVASNKEYTGEPPQRVNVGVFGALGTVASNLNPFGKNNTYGMIGQQSTKSWITETFYKPFEYVGKPKAYQTVKESPLNPVIPIPYYKTISTIAGRPQTNKEDVGKTYFEIQQNKNKQLFEKAGLEYQGEPVNLIPTRLGEKIVSDEGLRNKYQGMVTENTTEAGLANINSAYQSEASSLYSTKIEELRPEIIKNIKTNQRIFTPSAYPIITATGIVAGTAAVIAAPALSSGGLIARGAYFTVSTFSQGVELKGSWANLSTSQKALGVTGVALSGGFAVSSFNSGIKAYYGEWRNAIYEGLGEQRGTSISQQITQTENSRIYNSFVKRTSGANTAITKTTTEVFNTGESRAGFFTKGTTKVRIFDPETSAFISSSESFKVSGNIPEIIRGGGMTVKTKGEFFDAINYDTGLGSGIYRSDSRLLNMNFIAAARDTGSGYSHVVSGANPIVSTRNTLSTARGRLDSLGFISTLKEDSGATTEFFKITGEGGKMLYYDKAGAVTSQLGGAASSTVTKTSQDILIKSLSSEVVKTSSAAAGGAALSSSLDLKTAGGLESGKVKTRSLSLVSPIDIEKPNTNTKTAPPIVSGTSTAGLAGTRQFNPVVSVPAVKPIEVNKPGKPGTPGLIAPGAPYSFSDFAPSTPGLQGFGWLPLTAGFGEGLPSNILRGGKRSTGYVPSFSALIFKLTGRYKKSSLTKTGLDFRPINSGFKISRGRSFKLRL